jgi:hypothetical protein
VGVVTKLSKFGGWDSKLVFGVTAITFVYQK